MRRAFTLVELLVVIVIIGMLAAMALTALYAAREAARRAKTQSTISKLDVIVQARYAEFFSRRIPIKGNRRMPPDAMAELRFRVLHEIMRMEMPDRIRDITFPRRLTNTDTTALGATYHDIDAKVYPLATYAGDRVRSARRWVDTNGTWWQSQPTPGAVGGPAGITRTALARRHFRKVVQSSMSTQFDNAECLYLIVNSDPEAREQFQPNEIGDADEDGFFEFHDAWDRPIMFLRWAPGFRSDLQTGKAISAAGEPNLDPMNPRGIGDLVDDNGKWVRPANIAAFRLVPLIYSGGPDKEYGINIKGPWMAQFAPGDSVSKVWIDGADIGEPVGDDHHDNITNHSLGMN
jgi:prepilin-type N-terminal cleavage/methylation domain-containing protein